MDEEVFFVLGEENDLFHVAFAQAFELAFVDDGVRLDNDFAGRFVDDVVEDDTVDEFANAIFVELFSFFGNDDFFGLLVEEVQDVLSGLEADAAEHGGGRNLLLAVDGEVEHVTFDVEFDPRTTMRNDAALVVGAAVRLEFFVEAHTRRTVQLRNDNAFSTVDDKRTVLGHDRKFANQDVVLDFFLKLGIFAVLFEHAKGERGIKFHIVGKSTFAAFRDAVFRDTKVILFVFQGE